MFTIVVVLAAAIAIGTYERIRPNVELPKTRNWYLRAAVFNGCQALSAVVGTLYWDVWLREFKLLSFDHLNLEIQVLLGYVTITFVYYWWHRLRHSVPFLWRFFHQLHHSPARIEVITSFYKHPAEIVANGILSSTILYMLLGLSPEAVGLASLSTGLAELIYHMNVRTPRVMGYFFQRPEMHRIHHKRGSHHYNYSDLPIWDMLFGTFSNPAKADDPTGFPNDHESRVNELLIGRELES